LVDAGASPAHGIMNKRQKKKQIRLANKKLVKEFPFLLPKNVLTGNYKYELTLLDYLPHGWKKTLGRQLCEYLKAELVKKNLLKNYSIQQVKEKYGSIRWYDSGNSVDGEWILSDYEYISSHTCVFCGKIGVPMIDTGWISPVCKKCFTKRARVGMDYEKSICDNSPLETTYSVRRFSKDGDEIITRDIAHILNSLK